MKFEKYKCKHCRGVADVNILQDSEKATVPTIEFCPFCGVSNFYPQEPEEITGPEKSAN